MNTKEYTNWKVFCKCGEKIVLYRKKGPGRLRKIHRDRIAKDYHYLFLDNFEKEGFDIFCPSCNNRFATVKKINGKYVNKVNQGQLGIIRK